jgi:Tol biopolymer transport system component
MRLLDTTTAQPVPSALDSLQNVCDPSFSPDGTKLALAANCDPGNASSYPVEFRKSDLVIYDFQQMTRALTNPQTLQTSTGVGDAIAFPSFSPDSSFIFYQRGSYSRASFSC